MPAAFHEMNSSRKVFLEVLEHFLTFKLLKNYCKYF